MDNVRIGNSVEKMVSSILRKHGYWSYNCPKSASGGQPVDIIAIKGGKAIKAMFIDGKHVREETVSFALSRIEPNQFSSMGYITGFAKIDPSGVGFAVYFERDGKLLWLPYEEALECSKNGVASVNKSKMKGFEEALDEYDNKQ